MNSHTQERTMHGMDMPSAGVYRTRLEEFPRGAWLSVFIVAELLFLVIRT